MHGGLAAHPTPLLGLVASLVLVQVGAALAPMLLAVIPSARPPCGRRRGPGEVEFVVVTRALPGVMPALREVLERVSRGFPGYTLWVVTDDDSPGLPVLVEWKRGLGFRLVVVPSWYRRGRFKSRAIQYFIDYYVDEGKWYVFLDDDSYPLDDRFLCELDDSVPVYNGVIYPRRGRSLIAWLVDGSRYFHSISRQRLALQLLHKPVYGLHGELLIAKGWVLRRVPMASDSLVEDTLYAARLIRAGIPVGMVSTRVSILSPNSVVDLWRQRARWQLGVLRDMLRGLYPASLAAARGFDVFLWLLAPASPILWTYLAYLIAGSAVHLPAHLMAALVLVAYSAALVNHGLLAMETLGVARGAALAAAGIYPVLLVYYGSPIYALANARSILSRFVIIDKASHQPREAPRAPPAPEAPGIPGGEGQPRPVRAPAVLASPEAPGAGACCSARPPGSAMAEVQWRLLN
ncbi:MAG: glycosyltransferase family 2 protein [Desulfurococcales archaeon]|nr:glycosyltransferase family 2 protein [Desulfurococcales archaeon]